MAKANKAKATKAKIAVKKAKKSASKTAKKATSTPAPSKELVSAPMESVIQFVKMLIGQGHAEAFESQAREAAAVVNFDDHATAFVKKFLDEHRPVRTLMARAVRDPCPGNPFEC
jgi:hypothetical protein